MSKIGYIQRYLIIIRKIKKTPYISLRDLTRYVEEELAFHGLEHIGISIRTLQRDMEDIRLELGISIEYCRTNKGYYIPADEAQESEIERILEPFDILNSLNADNGLQAFVFPEHRKASGTEHLYKLIHAIKNKQKVEVRYRKYHELTASTRIIEPYVLKECRGRWYLIGKEDRLKTFGLDRIEDLAILQEHFRQENTLQVNELFQDSFGIIQREDLPVEKVVLAFDQYDGDYLKSLPLHHSQKVLTDNEDEFVIELKLKITSDFIMELLARSNSLRIIAPQSLKKHIHQIFQEATKRNSEHK